MGLTITGARHGDSTVAVRCADGLIAALGPDVVPADGDETLDAGALTLAPGLVNGHTHAAMTLFRGYGDDLPLMEWLQTRIWPAEARLTADDVYWGTRLACIEMIRSGTIKFFDMYWHPTAAGRAVLDSGMRAVLTPPVFDGMDPTTSGPVRDQTLADLDELATMGPLVEPSIGPHAIYTVSPDTLRWAAEVSAERDIVLHVHLSETQGEVDDCVAAFDTTPGHHVEACGVLSERALLAHGNFLTDEELALVAERGATVVTNPVSNLKLANGRIFPYPAAVDAGVALGLGTDGVASNDNLDLIEEMKFFALVQKHAAVDPAVAPAHDVLAIAQGRRSPLLGGRPLAVGEPADLLLLRTDAVELFPGDLDADLVYAASGHVVATTVVAGRVLMRDRHIDGEDEVRAEVRDRVPRITGTTD
jgi:5-methylthioadenosine/S-adenosylhomocysteine deaminase